MGEHGCRSIIAPKEAGEGDRHRHARAVEQARQHVTPEAIGAEEIGMLTAGRHDAGQQRVQQVLLVRIVRRDDSGEPGAQATMQATTAKPDDHAAGTAASAANSSRRAAAD